MFLHIWLLHLWCLLVKRPLSFLKYVYASLICCVFLVEAPRFLVQSSDLLLKSLCLILFCGLNSNVCCVSSWGGVVPLPWPNRDGERVLQTWPWFCWEDGVGCRCTWRATPRPQAGDRVLRRFWREEVGISRAEVQRGACLVGAQVYSPFCIFWWLQFIMSVD